MKDKQQYIQNVFKRYNENKRRLAELRFDTVHAVDLTKEKLCVPLQGYEQSLVCFLDEKRELEKQVELFDRVLAFYELEGKGKDEYIKQRYVAGRLLFQVSMDLYVSDRQLLHWDKAIRHLAERCADLYNLW